MQGIYFIDFETIPTQFEFPEGTPMGDFFKKRFNHEFEPIQNELQGLQKQATTSGEYIKLIWQKVWEKHAGIYAEYCKIISVSIGTLVKDKFYVKTITSRHEKQILTQLDTALVSAKTLCGHNLFEFDGPVGMRRYLINDMPIPPIFNMMTKKPWDIPYFDTMKMWSGSAWNYKISQDHLAYLLGVKSSKGELDGSKIAELYYSMFDGVANDELPFEKEQEVLAKISHYNAEDVVCNARIFAKMRGEKPITDEMIIYI